MASKRYHQASNIDAIANGKMPDRLLKALEKLELDESDTYQPSFQFIIKDGQIDLSAKWSIKKMLAVIGAVGASIGGLAVILINNWPTIQQLLLHK